MYSVRQLDCFVRFLNFKELLFSYLSLHCISFLFDFLTQKCLISYEMLLTAAVYDYKKHIV